MLRFLVSLGTRAIRAMCRRRAELVIENLALRQQVAALKKERPRPRLDDTDRGFWVALRASWPQWASRLFIVNPDTATIRKGESDRPSESGVDCTTVTSGVRLPDTVFVAAPRELRLNTLNPPATIPASLSRVSTSSPAPVQQQRWPASPVLDQ
jgi:hypothetical protein